MSLDRHPQGSNDIQAAAALLKAGGTVAFPTETVYGLGADASNPSAVRSIFQIKGRPDYHPLIVHIAQASCLSAWAQDIPDTAHQLAAAFWPGPLTLILKRSHLVPNEVTGGQDTVGLRVPDHPVASELLRAFGGGIAAPSANRFGQISPTTAQHVHETLGAEVGMILDGGACRIGVESTILHLTHQHATLLRPGGLSVEAIEAVLRQKVVQTQPGLAVRASGTMDSHYAPTTPIEVHPISALWNRARQLTEQGNFRVAVLSLGTNDEAYGGAGITTFRMPTAMIDYGHELYATLHRLDQAKFDCLLVEAPPSTSAWVAINDRLRRAAHNKAGAVN